jgi:ABC-type nickel/cobalt efflux system permease component RcnA
VSDFTGYALFSVAFATALFHTLIPDHWLPFVLIGNARGWRVGTTLAVSGVSALIHVAFSVLLGLLALGIGVTAARAIGESLEQAGAVLLVIFGVGYALWAWRKGGHFHPGGARVHSGEPRLACDGREGDTNPEHLHYHADEQLIAGRAGRNAWWLAFIVGVNPCVLILPIIMTTAGQGPGAVAMVCFAYAVPSVILMVGRSTTGVAGGRKFKLPLAARHMELISGMLIAVLGLLVLVLENH